jgi:hypothetical protein
MLLISIPNDTIRCYRKRVVEVCRLPVFVARVPEDRIVVALDRVGCGLLSRRLVDFAFWPCSCR